MRRVLVASVCALVFPALGAAASADETLRFETKDWIFVAPATLGTQADLELNGRSGAASASAPMR